jgi:hypothetical protein
VINHYIHEVEDFYLHQKNLIDLINEIPQNRFDNISHTDWNLPDNIKRDYVEYFKKFILNDFIENSKYFFKCCPEIDITKLWFQVYRKNDFHEEHTHGRAHFTNVFYVQLPEQKLKTKIKMHDGNELSFEAKEGQIVTFPAYWRHSSPINLSDKEKIIISFNLDCVCPSI